MIETVEFSVTGMTCGGCEHAVKRAVGQIQGVQAVTASHRDGLVEVTYESALVTPEAIAGKIQKIGYTVER